METTTHATAGMGATAQTASDKGFVPTLLLCFFVGMLGIHRFYVGKLGTGILQLVTFGGLGIWAMVDFILIATGNFKDSQGIPIKAS